jgi:hypothetical protein
MVKQDDWCEEISRVRNILRKSAQSGVSSDEVRWALGRLKELAEQEADPSLAFEYQRWSVHVGCMDEAA